MALYTHVLLNFFVTTSVHYEQQITDETFDDVDNSDNTESGSGRRTTGVFDRFSNSDDFLSWPASARAGGAGNDQPEEPSEVTPPRRGFSVVHSVFQRSQSHQLHGLEHEPSTDEDSDDEYSSERGWSRVWKQ